MNIMRSSKIRLKSYLFHVYQICNCVSYEKFVVKCRHIAALMFSFAYQLSNLVKTQVQVKNQLENNSLFVCFLTHARRYYCCWLGRSLKLFTRSSKPANLFDIGNRTYLIDSTNSGQLMNAQHSREQNLSLAEFHLVVKLFRVKQSCIESMP